MPQNPILVREKEGGQVQYMHTVDASEAMRLGDYAPIAPNEEVSPEERASAMSRFKTGQATTHPELQTEEEKTETRQKANEEAAVFAGLPPGTPVVVQAPSERPASRSAQQAAQRQQASSTSSGGVGSTSSSAESHPTTTPSSATPEPTPPEAVRPRRS
jgi:hypothetical protein